MPTPWWSLSGKKKDLIEGTYRNHLTVHNGRANTWVYRRTETV